MFKIGIITFHCANNYGAVLQAYGLQEYLKSQKYDAYVINYRPSYIVSMYAKWSIWHWLSRNPWKCLQRIIQEIRIKPLRIKRWNAFERFRNNHFNLYPYKSDSNFSNFDLIILGSDQIWNSNMVGGKLDDIYWGKGLRCKVIAYAASTRKFDYTQSELHYIKECLGGLSSIGVREESLRKYIQPLCSKEISVVLDPSLLAGPEIYKKIAKTPKESKYLLIYEIGRNEKTRQIAKFVSKKLGLTIIELVNTPTKTESSLKQTASPEEFIGYIQYASFVVTTSFHGTAFSFMFKRNFYAIKQNNSADDRIEDFVTSMDIGSQFIECESDINDMNININYDTVWKKYVLYRNKSRNFLKSAINNKY